MNDKLLIRVSIPIADIAYDFRIPYDLTAGTVANMITFTGNPNLRCICRRFPLSYMNVNRFKRIIFIRPEIHGVRPNFKLLWHTLLLRPVKTPSLSVRCHGQVPYNTPFQNLYTL